MAGMVSVSPTSAVEIIAESVPERTPIIVRHAVGDGYVYTCLVPWFGQERYWADQILALREQLALLEEEPLRLL